MNRREALLIATTLTVAGRASAGVMDWYNGVKVGAALPVFDTEQLGAAPPSEWKLRLIDFWATWCAPCREEFPHLNELYARFGSQGLALIGLTQEPRSVAEAFLPKVSIAYPVGAGGTRPLQKQLGIKALPYAVLVDKGNKIVWRGQASSMSASELQRRLQGAT